MMTVMILWRFHHKEGTVQLQVMAPVIIDSNMLLQIMFR
jgi:hypothetical protein